MKKIITISFIILLPFIFTSCKKEQENIKEDITINEETNIPNTNLEKDEIVDILESFHNDNIYVNKNLGIGSNNPVYYTDIYGSVSKVLYEDLLINKDYLKKGNSSSNHGGKIDNIDFITIHYTGNMKKGTNALNHAKYFSTSKTTSIHYIVGNDGIYQTLSEEYIAYHAGASSKMTWHKTGVKNDYKTPTFSISKKGFFTINNIETTVKVPYEKTYGYVTNSRYLNKIGLAYKIIDNEYYIGGSRWIYTQVKEGRICSVGGNNNSIGIETCVDEGSDLWYTWQKTAKLAASLLIKYNLDISRVVPHHFFSGKDCHQPFLTNNLELWNEFIKLVEAEYIYQTKLKNINIKFISNNLNTVNELGRIINPQNKNISYTISYNNKKINFTSNIM